VNGLFVTLEGPEGGGKSTQCERLAAYLQGVGIGCVRCREPGGTATGEAIREILQHDKAAEPLTLEAELFLFEASRSQLVHRVIVPALRDGRWVVCDRFADSTVAYQGYGRGFDIGQIRAVNDFAVSGVVPDLTILLDIEVKEGFARLGRRNRERHMALDRFERERLDFHERVRQGYLEMARSEPGRWCVVDAGQEPEAVWGQIEGAVKPLVDTCAGAGGDLSNGR
jgi:dTMP kinase